MINITNCKRDNYISWNIKDENNNSIVDYIFESRVEGTEVGERIVWLTLLRFAIMDCFAAGEMYIDTNITEYELAYLNQEIENMVEYSRNNHSFIVKKPELKFNKIVKEKKYPEIYLDEKRCYIGYSGGKDSKLCYDLIEDYFDDVIKFKINFETEEYVDDYREAIIINNSEKYDSISAKNMYESNSKNYYQEEDLHCCFAIPFYGVKNNTPGILSVGLQYDVCNYYVYNDEGERLSEFDLMETYDSLKCFEKLLRHYGLVNFRIFVPLASVTSFVIYNILLNKYGVDELRKMNSCWYPTPDNEPCGKCLKCKRVSYIYKRLGINLNTVEQQAFDLYEQSNEELDYLFGSISCKKLIEKNDIDSKYDLKNVLFVDEKINELDWGFHTIIGEKFGLNIEKNPLMK